jgi:RsiW-degrading membrane proteinase PrsW (M82 family)
MKEVLTVALVFGSVFGIIYVFLMMRNKERMALIEKGADASLFYHEKEAKLFNWSWAKFTLKIGVLLMGIAAGVFLSELLVKVTEMREPAIFLSMIPFFGGLSLLLYYLIVDRKSK